MQSDILQRLQKDGFRITAGRKATVGHFATRHEPFTAPQVHAALKKRGLKTNIASVYRELSFLTERGVLRVVQFSDGIQRFESADSHHHHHLVCEKCRSIQDIALPNDLDQLEAKIASESGFVVKNHALEFYGLCKDCQ